MNKRYLYIRWIVPVLILVALVGCTGAADEPQAAEATQETRSLIILSVEGTVQVQTASAEEPTAAIPGQVLSVGDELITGRDGQAVLEMDDGTAIVVTSESSFVVQSLEGTPESPISRFFLNLGEVFALREGELPDEAAFEIETPNGVAAIRGSMVSVYYDAETGQVVATCMTGHCSLTSAGVTIELTEGQSVSIEGFDMAPGEVIVLDDSQLQAWIDAINAANAGSVTFQPIVVTPEVTEEPEPVCSCEGPDLVCDDGTVIEGDEECLANCACDGPDFVCDDGTVVEDDEECLANCACDGPDFVCEGVTVVEDSADCLSECECDGFDLVCDDGTIVEGHEECGGCLCEGYDLLCDGTLFEANSAECGWVCDPTITCGNGTCDTECENSDLCLQDCPCADDGFCSPGEGFGCLDCVGPDEEASSACGAPCQEACGGELSCVDGICWGAPCEPPPPLEPSVTCTCVQGMGPFASCSDGSTRIDMSCNECVCYAFEGVMCWADETWWDVYNSPEICNVCPCGQY